jgi:hypothetical protein
VASSSKDFGGAELCPEDSLPVILKELPFTLTLAVPVVSVWLSPYEQ